MLGAFLRHRDQVSLHRLQGLLGGGHPDGGFLHDLISRSDVRFGVGGGGDLGRLGLADCGQGGAGFGHRLLGLLLPGEVTEGEDRAKSAGFAVGLFSGGDLSCGGLAGFGGFLGLGGSGAQGGLGGGDAVFGLGMQDLSEGQSLLQFFDLGGQLSDAGAERGGILVAIGGRGGGGDGHDRVTVLAEADDGLALGVDELLLRLDLTHGFGFADPQRRKGLVERGELRLEGVECGLKLRQLLLVLGDGLLRRFDARGGGDLGGFVLRLRGDEVGDVLLELGQLLLFRQDADVELGGLEGDDTFAMSGGLGDDVPDVRLGGGQVGLGLGEFGLGGAERSSETLRLARFGLEIGDRLALSLKRLLGLGLVGRSLRLADHAAPIGGGTVLFGELGLDFREFLGGRFAFGFHLSQRGLGGRDEGFGGLGGGFGRSERGR